MKNLSASNERCSDPRTFAGMASNGGTGDGATVRPATAIRIEKLRSLLAELSVREMGYIGVATHLNCSASCARNYVSHLLDLGVIIISPNKPPAGVTDKKVFRLSGVRALARRGAEHSAQGFLPGAPNRHGECRLRLETAESLSGRAGAVPLRDPLVAALFGAPLTQSDPQ